MISSPHLSRDFPASGKAAGAVRIGPRAANPVGRASSRARVRRRKGSRGRSPHQFGSWEVPMVSKPRVGARNLGAATFLSPQGKLAWGDKNVAPPKGGSSEGKTCNLWTRLVAMNQRQPVAQICNLLYRRIAFGRAWEVRAASRFKIRDTAGCKPALRASGSWAEFAHSVR